MVFDPSCIKWKSFEITKKIYNSEIVQVSEFYDLINKQDYINHMYCNKKKRSIIYLLNRPRIWTISGQVYRPKFT